MKRIALALAAVTLVLALPAAAGACVRVGVYHDDPGKGLPSLQRASGKGVDVVATYLTAGRAINPALISFVNRRKAGLLVTWMPDGGRDGAKQPRFRLTRVRRGTYDKSLKVLATQLRKVRGPVMLRPMPEPNTPWYAWSGRANGNTPASYVAAWKRVRRVVRAAGKGKVKLLWAPYARSIPDAPNNALKSYFPGRTQVDVVGTSAYNFGAIVPLMWIEPSNLFADAYAAITKLAPRKPFWIAETGSTAKGGDKAAWILALNRLQKTMPRLGGVVWFDVRDRVGDFRLTGRPTARAFRTMLKGSCR